MKRNWRGGILGAPTLINLRNALNNMEVYFREESVESGQPACVLAGISENELCDLPTFGGEEPLDTTGIFSLDTEHFLKSDGNYPEVWYLEPR